MGTPAIRGMFAQQNRIFSEKLLVEYESHFLWPTDLSNIEPNMRLKAITSNNKRRLIAVRWHLHIVTLHRNNSLNDCCIHFYYCVRQHS